MVALALCCCGEAYAADMNIIMPFRAAKLSHWDGTAVDDKKTIGQMLENFKNNYCKKITYEALKKNNGTVTILVGCIVDFDKFSYSSQLKSKYNDIKFVMSFSQEGTYIFPSGQGTYTTDIRGIAAGGMQWDLVLAKDAVDMLTGKAAYVADEALHTAAAKTIATEKHRDISRK